MKLPHQNIFSTIFSVTQAWEYRKWSSKTTFLRLLYEGILNYQALVEAHADEKSFLRKISLILEGKVKNKIKTSENKEIGVLEGNRERMLVEQ